MRLTGLGALRARAEPLPDPARPVRPGGAGRRLDRRRALEQHVLARLRLADADRSSCSTRSSGMRTVVGDYTHGGVRTVSRRARSTWSRSSLLRDGHDRRPDAPRRAASCPRHDDGHPTTTPSSSGPAAPACGPPSSWRKAGVDAAVLTKLYPTRSHTGAAQGGVCAALGNLEEDHWEWHMFDTIKGGDYLVDQDAAEILAREAIETVIELEHMGLPFNRTPEGKIDQRRFGGHTRNYGEGPVRRSCFAADRTGHMILQTLYQQCIKHGVKFYDEYHVVDLLAEGGELGSGGRVGRRRGLPDRRRRAPHPPRQGGAARDRRVRADVPHHLERLVADRRRRRAGLPPRHPAAGHGVLPVPPDRDRRDRHPAVRGGPRRGRHPAQRRGRAVHGALRARR